MEDALGVLTCDAGVKLKPDLRVACVSLLELDGHTLDFARELVVAFFIVCCHSRSAVFAHVDSFIGRENKRLGTINSAFGDLRAIDQDHARSARTRLAAVIGELESNCRLA